MLSVRGGGVYIINLRFSFFFNDDALTGDRLCDVFKGVFNLTFRVSEEVAVVTPRKTSVDY